MDKITPHLWFDREAVEAAELYVATFPDSKVVDVTTIPDTPGGDTDVVTFQLWGQSFQAISAGPLFSFNPSVSFAVACDTVEQVDRLWSTLAEGGSTLMPLDSYPWSERYGWLQDRYGVSWQISHGGGTEVAQRITPTLMFVGDVCGKTEEAIRHYASVFPDSEVGDIMRYDAGPGPDAEGTVQYAAFTLAGQQFAAMDSAEDHQFAFNEAISLLVSCDSQDEIDRYWDALSAVPEAEQCGWLKDRYGLSWQIVPAAMDEMLRTGTKEQIARVTAAFLDMKKFDIAALERAYAGSAQHD
ncbi:MAG TPA: VOC family protein [Egibacteraceae bacterium]|nr:VOC family protein [Egibacteraceae bacterium]